MAYSRDIERLVRTFVAQKLELEYIRHYLMESYQLDPRTIDQILEKVGVKLDKGPRGPGKGPEPKGPDKGKLSKQSFY